MSTYNLIIRGRVYPRKVDGKVYIYFSGYSKTDKEPGKRKEHVYVSRECYCDGSAWQWYLTKAAKMKLEQLPAEEYMKQQMYYLAPGRKVQVTGELREDLFGFRGMLVTSVEVIPPSQIAEETIQFNPYSGFKSFPTTEVEF